MGVFQAPLWHLPLLMCLAGLLQNDFCMSQRLVQVQEGPLYRVEGYPMSISCNVSGFKGPPEQNFEFAVYKPTNPNAEIQIISTADSSYAYALFNQRVQNKNIVIERLSGSSVVLHIKPLMADDSGTYDCSTPSTDGEYYGTYFAQTQLNVIKDSLKVSYSGPPSHRINEGEALQLNCQVSSETFQHTHLSVTWFLRDSPIITLDRDLTVRPGAAFEGRYHLGLVSMEKVEDNIYRLKMSQMQPSDSGQIYCQGQEWILDPDRSWIKIAYKNTTGSNVEIKAIEVSPDAGSFITEIEVLKGSLQEGEALEIRCSIKVQNLPGRFFSMSWLKNNMEVAHIGPSGVLIIAKDHVGRQKEGELRAEKSTDKSYVLTIHSVRTEDQGQYQCRATQEERTEAGTFSKGQSQLSPEETVHITTKESDLAVVMANNDIKVTEGETLQIICSVSGTTRLLSVTWEHKKKSESSFNNVISLNNKGVMEAPEAQYQQRGMRTFRSSAADFTLEISGAVLSDSGDYMCTVTEWNMESSGMKKINFQSQQGRVSVSSIDSLVTVVLKSRDTNVPENSQSQMICMVKAPKVPLAVKWRFQLNSSSSPIDIACMLTNGAVSCGGEQGNYQLESQVTELGANFILRLLNVSRQQDGIYQCQIEAYQKDVQKAGKSSNKLQVRVHKPVSKLSLSTNPKSRLVLPVNSNAKVDLFITGTFDSSRFAVTWMSTTQTLLKMDKDGVISSGNIQLDQRINIRMTERQTFQLTVQQIRSTESGQYRFLVEEWIQDPKGIWYSLQSRSINIEIVVTEKAHDFSLNKSESQLVVTEGKQVNLGCSLGPSLDATFQYSLSWFFKKAGNSHAVQLLTYSHDGRLQYQGHDPKSHSRLQFSRPSIGAFSLSIFNSVTSDSGQYHCQVDQYQLDCKGKWELKASDTSGFTNVNVHHIESKLRVKKGSKSLNVTDHHVGFTVECEIESFSSEKSGFEVTWTKSEKEGQPLTIFTVHRDGTLSSSMSDRSLVYDRPSLTLYTLTVPDVAASDNGQYMCQVGEELQSAEGDWRKVATDNSGDLSVYVESGDKQGTGTFVLEKPETNLNTKEGEKFDLSCSIKVDKVDPTYLYSITWYLDRKSSTTSTMLLKYNYDGHLQYTSEDQQLRSRLQFYRPNPRSFHLTVLNSVLDDSGSYHCKVEQYQVGCEGKWEMKGPDQVVSTLVNVHSIASNLRVKKVSHHINVTDLRAGFMVECEIISRSSEKSVFKVTWTKQQEGSPLIIFTASPDGTLHSPVRDQGIVYNRPTLTLYKLTLTDAVASDSGYYQCEVEELLQTASQTRPKVAVDTSGQLSVYVHTEGTAQKQREDECSSGTILGIFIPLLCVLLVIITLLLIANKKARNASQKQKNSLWSEGHPLKSVQETKEDA